ncbi:hypothetical protein [Cecembia sp.]|uniref:hypothetical protein n=1 Tax=Cecembia sp. TaxID=1898110 RepID=UPI0025C0DFA3|nr:hypothetical protein [Cecembia sp.]
MLRIFVAVILDPPIVSNDPGLLSVDNVDMSGSSASPHRPYLNLFKTQHGSSCTYRTVYDK